MFLCSQVKSMTSNCGVYHRINTLKKRVLHKEWKFERTSIFSANVLKCLDKDFELVRKILWEKRLMQKHRSYLRW